MLRPGARTATLGTWQTTMTRHLAPAVPPLPESLKCSLVMSACVAGRDLPRAAGCPQLTRLRACGADGLLVRGNVVARHIPYPLVPRLFPWPGDFSCPGQLPDGPWLVRSCSRYPCIPRGQYTLKSQGKAAKTFLGILLLILAWIIAGQTANPYVYAGQNGVAKQYTYCFTLLIGRQGAGTQGAGPHGT